MSIFYIADTHFGHENSIRFCNRPFADVNEMNRTLIKNWNAKVTPDDDVYVLGDFAYRRATSVRDIVRQLNGRKHLIIGNHDVSWMKNKEAVAEFHEVTPLLEIKDEERLVTLCHYPMMAWRNSKRSFSWLIHGHIHNNVQDEYWPLLTTMDRALNAGVDINNFMPVTFDELIENNRKWKRTNAQLA